MEGSSERKLQAVTLLYQFIRERKRLCISFYDLQEIFLRKSSEEFVRLFSDLIFTHQSEPLSEPEVTAALHDFTRRLDVDWPIREGSSNQQQGSIVQRGSSGRLRGPRRSCEENLDAVRLTVNDLYNRSGVQQILASDCVSCLAPQLLECVYAYMTKEGFEKAQVLARMKWLRGSYSEQQRWLQTHKKKWNKIIGGKERVNRGEFKQVFALEEFISDRLFDIADEDGRGELNQQQAFDTVSILVIGDTEQKLRLMFAIYDVNGNGSLERRELRQAFETFLALNDSDQNSTTCNRLTNLIFDKVKVKSRQRDEDEIDEDSITFHELIKQLQENPLLYDNLNIGIIQRTTNRGKKESPVLQTIRGVLRNIRTHPSLWVFVAVMVVICSVIGAERAYWQVKVMRSWVDASRVAGSTCGQILNFLLSLLLLLTLKQFNTKIKKTRLRYYLPLDGTLFLHKMAAIASFVIGAAHIVAQVTLILLEMREGRHTYMYFLTGGRSLAVFISGVVLSVLVIAYCVLSSPPIEKKFYNLYLVSHIVCAVVWYACMLIHAKMFVYWVAAPLALVLLERLRFLYNVFTNKSTVEEASTLENITFLTIKKPRHMTWSPGDYVVINIPDLSKFDWRPFTISSSKEDEITLHIRKVGRWTTNLYNTVQRLEKEKQVHGKINWSFRNHFSIDMVDDASSTSTQSADEYARRMSLKIDSAQILMRRVSTQLQNQLTLPSLPVPVNWKVYMNGPFSSPSYDIMATEHAILVAGGVGVTPFISILENVIAKLKKGSKICPCGCGHKVLFDSDSRVRRIDFFWLTRDLSSLNWFVEIFQELEEEQLALGLDPPLLNFHIYMTGLQEEMDMKGTFLHLALNAAYDSRATGLLTNLRGRTKPGRPDWASVLPELTADHRQTVPHCHQVEPKLYACGPARLCRELRRRCSRLDINYKEEIFY